MRIKLKDAPKLYPKNLHLLTFMFKISKSKHQQESSLLWNDQLATCFPATPLGTLFLAGSLVTLMYITAIIDN